MATNRRAFLAALAAGGWGLAAGSRRAGRDFPIPRYGARGDGASDCTAAIAAAIAACRQAGGGRVVAPAGEYATGPIELFSGVELHVEAGATLRFTTDPRRFPLAMTRYEGIELMNYAPLIRAYGQREIGISGAGTLDGGADAEHWWNWAGEDAGFRRDRELLGRLAEAGVPVARRIFGPGHRLRPQFIQPYRCAKVRIEGVRLRRSPMYHVHPVLCREVVVRGLDIESAGPNTDGCDPESCQGVLVEDCRFATGDDCIAIKSGRNADGRRLHAPARDLAIRGCRMERGHGAITIGSEISGGASGIRAEHCQVGPAVRAGLRIKNNAMRGGRIEDVRVRGITAGRIVRAAITIDFRYEEGAAGPYMPVCRNVRVEAMRVGRCQRALDLEGLPRAPIEDIVLEDCRFDRTEEPNVVRDVRGLRLAGVSINGRPAAEAAAS